MKPVSILPARRPPAPWRRWDAWAGSTWVHSRRPPSSPTCWAASAGASWVEPAAATATPSRMACLARRTTSRPSWSYPVSEIRLASGSVMPNRDRPLRDSLPPAAFSLQARRTRAGPAALRPADKHSCRRRGPGARERPSASDRRRRDSWPAGPGVHGPADQGRPPFQLQLRRRAPYASPAQPCRKRACSSWISGNPTTRSRSSKVAISSFSDSVWPSRRMASAALCIARMAARCKSEGTIMMR